MHTYLFNTVDGWILNSDDIDGWIRRRDPGGPTTDLQVIWTLLTQHTHKY